MAVAGRGTRYANGKATRDTTSIGFRFANEPPDVDVRAAAMINARFMIPAGAPNHPVEAGLEFLGEDLTPVFDQYLRRSAIPVLELAFNDREATLAYRWQADERAFAMRVRVGAPGDWRTIRPTTAWQVMPAPAGRDELAVATELYYIDVVRH